jgi:serine/threonine protein kinase/beta-lactam-binding protein with PASTA domain
LELEHVFNGRYRVDTRLGTGGMAIVYCGTDLLLRRRVAIKVLRDQFSADDDFIKRFSYEAQAAARLSHPNVVNVYDFGHEGDAYFIVMELVEGETLAAMLHGERRIPESVAIDYATQVAAGLAFAHRQGLLHRDVKPANILVTGDDVVKLGDFGIARAVSENAVGVTQPGMVMGSVAYVSPEQAQGRELDARSDLYSLGVVLYQMVTGRIPFNAETPVAVALKHVSEPAPQLDPFRDGVSPALASIVATLLQKNPHDRFASATELGRALREAREQPALSLGLGPRNSGDTPTSGFRSVTVPAPPPRTSAAPDRPGGNGVATFDEPMPPAFDRRWIPFFALMLIVAGVVGYLGARAIGPRKDIAVVNFVDRSSMQAQQSIVAAGLRPDVRPESSVTVPLDRVIRQDPAAGSMTSRGATVVLFVSSGAPLVVIPNVKGFTTSDAQHMLSDAKFKTKIVGRFDAAAAKDTVLDASPAIGSSAGEGSTITLTVSQGRQPVRVPQLVGASVDSARGALAKLGLKLNIDQQTASDLIPSGTIVSQAQGGGSMVDPGSTVGLTVSTGPVLVSVPDVGAKSPADAVAALQAAGFTPRIQYIVDASNAGGNVSAQDPAANATAPRRSTVTINVAVPGTVPDVANMALDDAKRAIIASGYTVGNVAVTQDGSDGKVARTEPEANASLRPGEAVTIYYHGTAAH